LVGQHVNLLSFGVAGRLARNAPSVGAALQDLAAHFVLHDSGGVPSIAIHDDTATLAYGIHTAGVRNADQVYDQSAVSMLNVMRQLCGAGWKPDAVLLPRRRPTNIRPYREILAAPLHFDAVQCAVIFPASWLARPVADADPLLHMVLQDRASAELTGQGPILHGDVRRTVRLLLLSRQCSRANVAKRLGIHPRTLGRRLQESGTTFQALLDETRAQMAKQLLLDTRLPIARIAAAVGYEDPTIFTRAFARWTGRTPSEFRVQVVGRSSTRDL
jgi:AraC-like DNA-binding protein